MIYFIRDEATKFIKIGHTDGEMDIRRRDLQTGCPGFLVVLLCIDGSKQDEDRWHDRFEAARERGEWFRPVPELLRAIDEMKASIEENVSRMLEKLRKEQEEFERSGGERGLRRNYNVSESFSWRRNARRNDGGWSRNARR